MQGTSGVGTKEDPIIDFIFPFYKDEEGKYHLAIISTVESCIVGEDGARLDRKIKELKELIDQVNQGLNQKLQYDPVSASITQNPETYPSGHIYVVDGDVTEENGHPYTAWAHITYLVYGFEEKNGNGYKNIIAINYQGTMYLKSQNWDQWSNWKIITTLSDLETRLTKKQTIYNKNRITNEDLIGNAFIEKSWLGVGLDLENAPVSDWLNYFSMDAAATGSDLSQVFAVEIHGLNPHVYFSNDVRGKNWKRFLDTSDFSGTISGENFFINSNFQISQWGMSSYTTNKSDINGKYYPDRWKCCRDYNDNELEYTIKKDGLHAKFMTPSGSYGHIYQILDTDDSISLSGKTITFSVNSTVSAGTGGIRCLIIYQGTTKIVQRNFDEFRNGIYFVTVTLPVEITDKLMFAIHFSHDVANGEVVLHWAKLEVGDVVTMYIPPVRTFELLKCKRYFQKIGGWWKWMTNGFVSQTNKVAYFPLVLQREMRTVPTITIKNKDQIEVVGCNIHANIVDLEGFQHASENYYNISFTLQDDVKVENVRDAVTLYFGKNVELYFNAEIYL